MNPIVVALVSAILVYCLAVFLYINYIQFKSEKAEEQAIIRRAQMNLSEDETYKPGSLLSEGESVAGPMKFDNKTQATIRAIEKVAMLLGTTNKSICFLPFLELLFLYLIFFG